VKGGSRGRIRRRGKEEEMIIKRGDEGRESEEKKMGGWRGIRLSLKEWPLPRGTRGGGSRNLRTLGGDLKRVEGGRSGKKRTTVNKEFPGSRCGVKKKKKRKNGEKKRKETERIKGNVIKGRGGKFHARRWHFSGGKWPRQGQP